MIMVFTILMLVNVLVVPQWAVTVRPPLVLAKVANRARVAATKEPS